MRKFFPILIPLILFIALLFPSLSFANDQEFLKTSCQVTVSFQRVAFFSNEPGRIWQVAFLNDLKKIKKRNGKMPNTALLKIQKSVSERIKSLIENRIILTETHQAQYQENFLGCLDRKNNIRFKNELISLRQGHKKETDQLWKEISNSKAVTRKRIKALKKKLKKKKMRKAAFTKKRKVLVAKKRKIYVNAKKKIKEENKKLNEGILNAQKDFTDQIPINQDLASDKAAETYIPVLKEIVMNNDPAFQKTKSLIGKLIGDLNERTKQDGYRWVRKGPLKINWSEVRKSPTLKGEKPISVKGRTKFF